MARARVVRVDPENPAAAALTSAAETVRQGGLVAVPTETVYGIAVNLENAEAVRRVHGVRGNPAEKRITVHIGERDDLRKVVPGPVPAAAQRLIRKFWPGPLTVIFPTRDRQGIAVRYSSHKVACEVVRRAGVRVGVSEGGAVTGEEATRTLEGKVDMILDAGPTRHRALSTVVRLEGGRAQVVREGAIPRGVIDEVNVTTILFVCTGNTCRSPMAEAVFRHLLARRLGVEEKDLEARGWRVLSAGTAAGYGGVPSEEAQIAVKELGAGLSGHVSKPVSVVMVEDADRIYVMTKRHKEVLEEWMPEHAEKIQLLDPAGGEVEDPIGGTVEVYRAAAKKIRGLLDQRLKEFA